MYRMYNCDFETLKKSRNKIEPFVFNDGEKSKSSFYIDELDLITSKYESFNSFYNDLLEFGNKYVDGNNLSITIIHESSTDKNKIYYDEVIYNDKLVFLTAFESKKNRKNKENKELTNTEKLSHFIDYIKNISISSTSDYLLDPESVEGISKEDSIIMSSCLKGNYERDGKTITKGLHNLLLDYRKAYFINQEQIIKGHNNDSAHDEMIKLSSEINEHIRNNYKVFRDLIVWDNRYLNVLHKMYNKALSNGDKLYFFKHIVDVNMEKDFRNDRITDGDLFRYYDEYRSNIDIDDSSKIICNCNRSRKLTDRINDIANHGSK